ncbi:hypothetical protein Tco_1130171 [Tanacetum coccineum]
MVHPANVPASREVLASPPTKESTVTPTSKSLELSTNVNFTASDVTSEHNEDMVNAVVDGSDLKMTDDTVTVKSGHAFVQGISVALDDVIELVEVGSRCVSSGPNDVVVTLSAHEKGDGLDPTSTTGEKAAANPSRDYDEEREMEPWPEPRREATPTLQLRSLGVRRQRERVVGFEDAPSREGNIRGRNAEGIRPSEIEGGHQPSTNTERNLPPNGTLLSHHAQPFISSSLHIPTGLVPTPVNPYSQPLVNLVHGQAPNFLFQIQMGNPPAGGAFNYQRGYIPQAFINNSVSSYNGPIHPTVTPSSSYPFYAQPMYAPPNIPAYPNPTGSFAYSAGFVTHFVRWIEDYPLPDGLKMPSHIGSYDGKGDPDNFLHLFIGVIHM